MPDDPGVGSWAMETREVGTTTCATNSRSSSKARSVPAAAAPGPTAATAPASLSYSLLRGFPSAALERQYVQYKHRLYLILDYCCAVFASAYMLSILGRMAWERDARSSLPILAMEWNLDDHYREEVIGGPGAFMIPVASFEEFAPAVLRKLVTEIAGTEKEYKADMVLLAMGFTNPVASVLDAFGVAKFHDMMCRYRDALGPQFQPAQIIIDYAKANKKFHP